MILVFALSLGLEFCRLFISKSLFLLLLSGGFGGKSLFLFMMTNAL
jgi:hypothetical protein